MSSITLFNFYQYLQRSLKIKESTFSLTKLLLDTQKKLLTKKKEKIIYKLDILYPARTANDPKLIIQKLQSQTPVTTNYVAPREPIVLCHGLFGFDVRGPENIPSLQLHYWSGIEETLAKLGCKLIITRVPQAGSIWERSLALHNLMESILNNKQKVNFVAHSMGGLDCRHLLANIKHRSYQVESLTTICTPHRGSPVMDWFRDNFGLGKPTMTVNNSTSHSWPMTSMNQSLTTQRDEVTNKKAGFITSTRLDKLLVDWFDEPAYAHLTTDFCKDYFNPNTPDDPSVKYYSYGASANIPAYSSLLSLPYQMVHEKEGENDGIVSIQSAKWGTYVKTIQADHWDFSGKSIIPYRLRTSKTESGREFDRLDFYAEMATHLYQQGH